MTLVGWLLLVGVLAAAIGNHIRLSKAIARVDSLYSVLYGFKYRIREVEAEVKGTLDGLRFEINPEAAPQTSHSGCGCSSHEAHQQAGSGPILQIH
jgi:hypothetical protein